ncbi:serine hydrolase domain-containing protein [Actinomadura hibisca]|uniref:serine hydrolase domain-containing protein n=1 Tax=Actinomadura hibisca TaxID=68565 RepID=UPI000A01915C|nr:serine hydrolase domain-containing protein [Actinomadura hibisca]
MTLAFTAAAGSLVAVAAPAHAQTRGCGDYREARRVLERMTKVHGLPGAAVRVDDPRCGTWTAASGVADMRTGRPMRADMRGRIASVSKSFTAATLLGLVADGRVALDAPVDRYLPGLIRTPAHDGRRITVRSLLRHTSGLPDHSDSFPDLEPYRFTHFEPEELVRRALALPPPEAGWYYSTTNYVLAGMIVARVTGRPFEREVERRIIGPLGLRDTYWPGDRAAIRGPHPRGYHEGRDVTEWNMSAGGAGGALISSPRDVNRFFGALADGRLLPAPLLAEMRRTVPADPDRTWPGTRYGLGLMRLPLNCGGGTRERAWYGHGGHFEGWSAMGAVGPAGRRVSFLFNAMTTTEAAAADEINLVDAALCEK